MWRASSDCTDRYVVGSMKSPLRAATSGSATKTTFVNAVSATTCSVNAHWIGSPTMKCDSMFMPAAVMKSFGIAAAPLCQPAGSGECLAYQRASEVCSPVWRTSSTNWTW